jgi:putative aldouronate transport system permease protein
MVTSIRNALKKYWQLYTLLMLPLTALIIFSYVPMVGLQIAFKDYRIQDGMRNSLWVGLGQFESFFNAYQFWKVLRNTIVLSLYAILAAFPFPIMFALCLNIVTRERYKKVVQTIVCMPHFISVVVLVGILMQILHPMTGVYGSLMRSLTGTTPNDPMANPTLFPHLYVWSGVWQGFGYNSIIYTAALTNVSAELHEAAQIDGASRFQRVRHVDIPAILPTIVSMLILRTGHVMSIGFEKAYLMQNNLNISSSEIISTFVYKMGLGSGASNDYSYSAAIGMFNSVVNLLLIVIVNSISSRLGETSLW